MLDVARLICGKMKGDAFYNESIKQKFGLVTKFGDSDVAENENNVLIALSQILSIINKNQLNLIIYGSSCSHPHTQANSTLPHDIKIKCVNA